MLKGVKSHTTLPALDLERAKDSEGNTVGLVEFD
jgi:hypothetical protein